MRRHYRWLLMIFAAALAGCGGSRPGPSSPARPPAALLPQAAAPAAAAVAEPPASEPPAPALPAVEATPAVAVPKEANLTLSVSETIAGPEEETLSQTKVYVDGQPAGETHIGPKSQPKTWGARLSPGNHLFRFEQWALSKDNEWAALPAEWQPRERFVRVDEKTRAVVGLRFYEAGRRHNVQTSREALP